MNDQPQLWTIPGDDQADANGFIPTRVSPDAMREALEALSMWCTCERRKIRGRGGFDGQTEREIGIGIVEFEIDRRAKALSAPVPLADGAIRKMSKTLARLEKR